MNVTPATAARQTSIARRVNRVQANVLVYSTTTGQTSTVPTVCREVKRYGTHVLDQVIADLPGDRSVGYCTCGEYMDTGTFDERN